MFAYCNNSPIVHSDSTGLRMVAVQDLSSGPPALKYDVELFEQGDRSMCWAYCQVMDETYNKLGWGNQKWADRRAKMIGINVYGILNWNQGGWPINLGDPFEVADLGDIYYALKDTGPFYAVYDNNLSGAKSRIHMVLVTGVDPQNNIVYTNNPWGMKGEQSFDEFLNGVAWDEPNKLGMTFKQAYYAN